MEFKKIQEISQEVREVIDKYNSKHYGVKWELAECTQGLVADVGELVKLVMTKNGYRGGENVDSKLAHELSDCLWSIIVIANKLNIDLEKEFMKTMREL